MLFKSNFNSITTDYIFLRIKTAPNLIQRLFLAQLENKLLHEYVLLPIINKGVFHFAELYINSILLKIKISTYKKKFNTFKYLCIF